MDQHVNTCNHLHVNDLPGIAWHHIFSSLTPRDLGRASVVCKLWREHTLDSLSDRLWQGHFTDRWRPVKQSARWQAFYGTKMAQVGSYRGRGRQDRLNGHRGGVRCLGLLPIHNQLATGSADRTVKLWDLSAGTCQQSSKRLGGVVRSLALDEDMLVAGTSQDHAVWMWRGTGSGGGFKLSGINKLKQLHSGPVSSVALTPTCIYSGSWDYGVRIWSRATLECKALIACSDWVDAVAPRGSNLLVAAGPNIYVHSLQTAQRIRHIACPPASVDVSARLCIEGRWDSRLIFTGSATGQVLAHDLRCTSAKPVALLENHHEPVSSLALEDPWLAAAHSAVSLIDVDAAMRGGRGGGSSRSSRNNNGPQQHARTLPAAGAPLQCVDIAEQWVAAATKIGIVQSFDFTAATAAEARSAAARSMRRAARQARTEHNRQRWQHRGRHGATAPANEPVGGLGDGNEQPGDALMAEITVAVDAVVPEAEAAVANAAAADLAKEALPAPCSQPSADRPSRMPRWQIIRPQRCKYRHVAEADNYEECEAGA